MQSLCASNVFIFCPDGTIPIAFFNVPGCTHDSQIADYGDIYDKLESMYRLYGAKCTVDSAFRARNKPYLIKSAQDNCFSDLPTSRECRTDIQRKREATSMRQSAEWGMRMLQAGFPRLKERFVYEERGERRIILKCIVLLHNLRSRMVGINQLQSVYMPYLLQSADEVVDQGE